jgi:NitT/TauT family transport system permease protein
MLLVAAIAFSRARQHEIHILHSVCERYDIPEWLLVKLVIYAYVLAFFLLTWEAMVDLSLVDPVLLASPSQAISKIPSVAGEASHQLASTFLGVGIAFVIATIIGVSLGIVIGSRRYLYEVSDPIIVSFYSVPKVLFLPLFIVWIGIGLEARILYAAYAGVFPVVINTITAVREISPNYIYYARTSGATTRQILLKVIIPSIVPMLLTGLRLALAIIMTSVLLAEMYMPFSGIGSLIVRFAQTLSAPELYASIIMMAFISATLVLSILVVEGHFNKWRRKGLELAPIRF